MNVVDSWGRQRDNDNGTGICLYCMYGLFGILVYLDAYIPKPGWSREGLGLLTGQGTLPCRKSKALPSPSRLRKICIQRK